MGVVWRLYQDLARHGVTPWLILMAVVVLIALFGSTHYSNRALLILHCRLPDTWLAPTPARPVTRRRSKRSVAPGRRRPKQLGGPPRSKPKRRRSRRRSSGTRGTSRARAIGQRCAGWEVWRSGALVAA